MPLVIKDIFVVWWQSCCYMKGARSRCSSPYRSCTFGHRSLVSVVARYRHRCARSLIGWPFPSLVYRQASYVIGSIVAQIYAAWMELTEDAVILSLLFPPSLHHGQNTKHYLADVLHAGNGRVLYVSGMKKTYLCLSPCRKSCVTTTNELKLSCWSSITRSFTKANRPSDDWRGIPSSAWYSR